MSLSFTYDAIPGRVVFGVGSRATVGEEAAALGSSRVLLIAARQDAEFAEEVADSLGGRLAGRFDDVVQHVPVANAEAAAAAAREAQADSVVTVGGGSSTGFGKALRLSLDVRFLAVPTTYAGSEMTTIWGLTDGDHKETGKDLRVKPDTVVYDPELTLTLPAAIAGPSGMNALAHCVEALYGPGANPLVTLQALEGIRALAAGLPRVCGDGDGLEARTDVLYGAYLAGVALASGGTALHHKTCHVLGGMFGLDHGQMNAVVLGHALAYNAPAIPELLGPIADALGTDDPEDVGGALYDLAVAIGAPVSLEAIGMPANGSEEAARRSVDAAADNIRSPDLESVRGMLKAAFEGSRPVFGGQS